MTATCAHAADESGNLLGGAAYRLDPAPNYQRALGPAGTELTDGRAGEGRIWTSGEAVGWTWRMPVTATFDLDAPAVVDHVRVHAASGTDAGIHLPSQLLVFGRDGSGPFAFLGASELGRSGDDSKGPSVGSVDIRFGPSRVSQLVVVGFARGPFLILSEVEAFGSSKEGQEPDGALADAAALLRFAIDHRRAAIEVEPDARPTGPDMARRWAMPLGPDANEGMAACTAERVDPWTGERAAPAEGSAAAPAGDAPLVALTGGRDYAAWRIVNRSRQAAPVTMAVAAPAGVEAKVFALAHAQALDRSWVPDVVTPFEPTTLPPRSAMLVLVEASPQQAGHHEMAISIGCAEETRKDALALTAVAADPTVQPLHGNLWTYLHEPPHAPVARALACEPNALAGYGVDTVVVHPGALKADGGRPEALLRDYFKAYRDAARVLLYMNIRDWAFAGMPDEDAAEWLRHWWDWVRQVARDEDVGGELLLYPIDEPRYDDLQAMMRFHGLVKKAGIEARIYATLEKRSLTFLPWVDVAQLHRPSQAGVNLAAFMGLSNVELYDTREDGKLLSPGGYYRRQGWDAFAFGLAGIGVWSAWDSTGLSSPETGWNPFTGERERDFGMLYAGPDGCAWPSLRLLAWRRGLEENRLLKQCEAKLTEERVKRLARSVLDGDAFKAATTVISSLVGACS
ncbi:MAG: hypothetical protein ABTQ31_16500 [Rhizobiaceae bacterium]